MPRVRRAADGFSCGLMSVAGVWADIGVVVGGRLPVLRVCVCVVGAGAGCVSGRAFVLLLTS